MGFDKFVTRILTLVDATSELYSIIGKILNKPCLMAAMRYHYENDRILRTTVKACLPDMLKKLQETGIHSNIGTKNADFLTAACKEMAYHLSKAETSHSDLSEVARASEEILDGGDQTMISLCGSIIAQNSSIESAVRLAVLRCCNQFSAQGMLCMLPESC